MPMTPLYIFQIYFLKLFLSTVDFYLWLTLSLNDEFERIVSSRKLIICSDLQSHYINQPHIQQSNLLLLTWVFFSYVVPTLRASSCSIYIKAWFNIILSIACMCGRGSFSTYFIDRMKSKAFRLINAPNLTYQLPSLKLRRNVASLSIFHKYYFGRYSEELSHCVPDLKNRDPTLESHLLLDHELCVQIGYPRIERYNSCFFSYTGNLLNFLPSSNFPSS